MYKNIVIDDALLTQEGFSPNFCTRVYTRPTNPCPFSYKIYEKDTLSLTKFAETITHLLPNLGNTMTILDKSRSFRLIYKQRSKSTYLKLEILLISCL